MQRRGKELVFFDILSPVLIHYVVSYAVSIACIILLFVQNGMEGLTSTGVDQSKLIKAVDLLYEENGLILSGIVAAITIPVFVKMYRQDKIIRKEEKDSKGRYNLVLSLITLIPLGVSSAVALNQMIGFLHLEHFFKGYNETREVLFSGNVWLSVLVLGMLVPVAEEFLFRGLVFKRMENQSGFYAAMVSSLLFGAYHLNVIQFIYAFCFGLILTFVYKYYGTVAAPVLVHASANLFIYFASGIPWFGKSPLDVLSCLAGTVLSACILISIKRMMGNLHL